ncbi:MULTISPECIES: nucleoside hydrolase [Pseudomonas]|uniref:Inosine-uridine nucleoside N-ribohydrolase n=1 Tax=Pseudomonas asplenii TaxID=53407 RepID=A0A0M9GD37_9PSED|nr:MULTISPECIES: nucleoside hydrolase [Pseudomonas]KPA88130.1 Inosine-uridine nucleoside N-ribohydrolase [Pseudomonas fuscovaginae]KPA98694.1 Inosine-uridine nucleoside N-ribohydrolase [Pseudomonas fuscovaginae]
MSAQPLTHVLVDTDVDFDDYMAISYLLKHHAIKVDGITVTGVGAVHLSHGVENINNFLTLFNDKTIEQTPVVAGFQRPLLYSNTFAFDTRQAADKHYDAAFPRKNANPTRTGAVEFIRETLESADHKFTVLLIGGGTTWGHLFRQARTDAVLQKLLRSKVERIVVMGGNLLPQYVKPGAGGNIKDALGSTPYYTNEVAEWNIFLDPLGAQLVFDSGIPVQLVALNASNDIPITQDFVRQLSQIKDPVAQFLTQVLGSSTIVHGIGNYLYFWDPLAAVAITDPQLITFKPYKLRVEQELNEEQDTSGQLIPDEAKSAVDVALDAASGFVLSLYLATLAGRSTEATVENTR